MSINHSKRNKFGKNKDGYDQVLNSDVIIDSMNNGDMYNEIENNNNNNSSSPQKESNSRCTRKCCCFCCLLLTVLALSSGILLLIYVFIPKLAQQTTDQSSMTVLSMHLSNATNNSILMNVTMQLSNAGAMDATINSALAYGYLACDTEEEEECDLESNFVGTMQLPTINVKGGEGATFDVIQPLSISNITNFQTFTKTLLSGIDTSLQFKAKPSLDVSLFGFDISSVVNLDTKMTLPGSAMENVQASNISVISAASSDRINGLSQISFSTHSIMALDIKNVKIEMYNMDGVYIGYSIMPLLSVIPGYNKLDNLPTIIDRNNAKYNNSKAIEAFLSQFMMGINQEITIVGPIPYDVNNDGKIQTSVIDGCLKMNITAKGSTDGDTILNGMITSETQQGWTVKNGSQSILVQGAYSTIKNPLDVGIRVLKTESDLFLRNDLQYGYKKTEVGFINILKGNCTKTNKFAHIRTGYGMYKNEPNKTYVDIPSGGVKSFFVIAEPQYGQYGYNTPEEKDCSIFGGLIKEPYPCCFLFETLAAICQVNPDLSSSSSSQLSQDFVEMRLESNMTLLIDSQFKIELTYSQEFFPIYFGKEVYEGYSSDLWFTCSNIQFPYVSGVDIDNSNSSSSSGVSVVSSTAAVNSDVSE